MRADRRKFLKFVSAGAIASAIPASIKRALAIPAHHRTGTIDDVEHIVILMQENRSFDHYFGTLRGVRGFGDPRAVTLPSGRSGLEPAERHRPRRAVPPRRAEPRPRVPRGSRRTAGPTTHAGVERRQVRPVGAGQGHHDDGVPDPQRHPVPVRARRRVHGLRRVPLLVPRADRSESLSHVDGLGRQRRQGRRSRPQTTPRPATTGPRTRSACRRPASPGRSTRTPARGSTPAHFWGWGDDAYIGNYGDNSLLYFHQYQNVAAGQPALRGRADGHEHLAGRHALRHLQGRRPREQAPAGLVDRRARGLHRAPELAGELRRLVRLAVPRRAHRESRRSGARPRSS